ncbi:DUF5686 family protein [Flavobacterium sp. DGU11]|uniref:DUF5686 family protein n=1 Tax=Flavobacterium arundinis TaxID=3139143 RepID=A0ABU9HTM1_9FLAO
MKLKNLLLFLSFFVIAIMHGQHRVSGKVTDATTHEPLAFASIIFNNDSTLGISTDIDGKFSWTGTTPVNSLTCSYVGYTSQTIALGNKTQDLVIELAFAENELKELVITPTEDPAYGIMRKVIANKEKNDPENIASFRYKTYNKVIYDIRSEAAKDSLKMRKVFKDGHLMMMESVTERKYLKPEMSEEVVLATKVSGFKNPSFASLATDLQPFSFYKDNIPFLNSNYLNPISKGSLSKYRFTLRDTLYREQDTVYIISYKPLPHKNFDGLTGLLYINTNKYAVQNVTASPYDKGKIDIQIKQQYVFTKEGYWFPEQLDFTLEFTDYPTPKTGMYAQGKSYIDNVEIGLPLTKRDFRLESVWIEDNAAKKDSVYWEDARREKLNTAETTTYTVLDSLGQKGNFDGMLLFMEKFARGRIPIKFIDIDVPKTLVYNKYEGARWGLGLYTNEKLFEKLTLGGFFGYGSRDYKWKYGGEVIYEFSKKHQFTVGAKYQDNLVETGNHGFDYTPMFYNVRSIIAYQMDRIEENSLNIGFRTFRYAKWNIGFRNETVTPQYDYVFINNDGTSFSRYKNTELSVNLRFAFRERFVQSFKQNVSQSTKYPILYLSYSRGLKDAFGGELNYNKIEGAVEQSFFTKNIGKSSYRLEAGYIDRTLPYGLLFTGEGSYDKDYPVIMKNTFQTMMPYEFLSDKYANLFTSHNFGGLLFKAGWFQPQISIHNNFSWGDLTKGGTHNFITYKTKNKLFTETGLQLDNLFKMNYLNIGYLGFGAGLYYRYGGYSLPDSNDNFAFKFTLSFSVK